MAIEILPPQLANQIAAGEVVERPASVVKELVENSIDAGATRIDIDIEKGGAKLIRIRDNGGGICRDELALALSRHATSKVHCLDDLEAIISFGFRGEALASISSVSRLTLTSRTQAQSEAWAAYAEGSEMVVKVVPAAHPVGTTIDVVDLFFNTPARRRFLKSDKTEFSHIDEWLKRIALVRQDVHFTLSHNGKTVRNYRPAATEAQFLQRLAQVSSKGFAEQALQVTCEHDDMSLQGYLQHPGAAVDTDVHYFYVNGRLVRDRLVNHAVRQAFSEQGATEQAGYVLMLTLDPHQVDVNVHPAKHEVRFHQSRYVHDFILQALQSALRQAGELALSQPTAKTAAVPPVSTLSNAHSFVPESKAVEQAYTGNTRSMAGVREATSHSSYERNSGLFRGQRDSYHGQSSPRGANVEPDARAVSAYRDLMQTPGVESPAAMTLVTDMPPVLDGEYWVIAKDNELRLISISHTATACCKQELLGKLATGLVSQPLLMPVSVAADSQWLDVIAQREQLLRKLGIELTIRFEQLIIKKVPPYLRDCQLAVIIPELLQWLTAEVPADMALAAWIADKANQRYLAPAQCWQQLSQLPDEIQQQIMTGGMILPWQTWLEEQLSDTTTPA